METYTLDGYTITTIEQDGAYAGEDIGRLWFKTPGRTNVWTFYGHFSNEARRNVVLAKAQSMTFRDFQTWWEMDAD